MELCLLMWELRYGETCCEGNSCLFLPFMLTENLTFKLTFFFRSQDKFSFYNIKIALAQELIFQALKYFF